jgi:hypothetical protein
VAEIVLHDNSKLAFTWVHHGLLSIELWQPGSLRDGHGWLLQGSTQLADDVPGPCCGLAGSATSKG